MKEEKFRKISFSPILALFELFLGVLLLFDPIGLSSVVIIITGVLLTLLGAWNLFRYMRRTKEEATQSWDLATGAALITLGICAFANQKWFLQVAGSLTAMYGLMILVTAFMKLQIAVDALRSRRPFWYLMAISFLLSGAATAVLFLRPFADNVVWIFSGILLILLGLTDGAYYLLKKQKK